MKKQIDTNKVVVVLGSPRSGTSLISGLLTILGVDMGEVRPPDFENPTGYYEDVHFSRLIAEIFKTADPESDGFHPPDPDLIKQQYPNFVSKARSLVLRRSENSKGKVWGWKVTSTIFVIDLFLEHLDNPHFVVVLRNPLDIARSMVKYTKRKGYREISLLQGLRIANYYYENIFEFLDHNPNLPWIPVSYEDVVDDPKREILRLAAFLNLKIKEDQVNQACQFVDPDISIKKDVWRMRWQLKRLVGYATKGILNPVRALRFITKKVREKL